MDNQVLSVSEFNALVNQTLEFAYPRVTVEGEITEARPTKHFYFSLKDNDATLRCIKWGPLRDPVENGMKVRVTGRPQLHAKFGFSFIADTIEPAGQGSIQRAFELLRAKLEAEGLFSPQRKRLTPQFPRRIGVVSSLEAAGYKDFLKIVNNRWRGVDIQLANVQVQGANAPAQITRAIDYFNQLSIPPDVLAIVRGGGALEDLQSFNTEEVVRAIVASRVPTITGIGHEIDTTLADMVADVRAATPTDAATIVVPSKQQIIADITQLSQNLISVITAKQNSQSQAIQNSMNLLEHFIYIPRARLTKLEQNITSWLNSFSVGILGEKQKLKSSTIAITNSLSLQIQKSKWEVESSIRTMRNLDPKAVLGRGYAIARSNGKVIKSTAQVKVGDVIDVDLSEGSITTGVTKVV